MQFLLPMKMLAKSVSSAPELAIINNRKYILSFSSVHTRKSNNGIYPKSVAAYGISLNKKLLIYANMKLNSGGIF